MPWGGSGEIEESGMDEKAMAPIWQNLRANRDELAAKSQLSLFEADPRRFEVLTLADQD